MKKYKITFKKFIMQLKTILKHKMYVFINCYKCGIIFQGIIHDNSKFSPTEFWNAVRYYTGNESPHKTEMLDRGYSKIAEHHKSRNKHHPEYWSMNNKATPYKYLVEIICDRVAASIVYTENVNKVYNDFIPLDYYLNNPIEGLNEKDAKDIEDILRAIAYSSHNEVFKLMKKALKMNLHPKTFLNF